MTKRSWIPGASVVGMTLAVGVMLAATPAQAQDAGGSPPSPRDMFAVLRSGPSVVLPADAQATLRRLESKAPGNRVAARATQTRLIGPRGSALYLVAAPNGICAVHGGRGICSDDLAAIADHGVRFSVPHTRKANGDRPIDLYGALPDHLSTVSVMVDHEVTVRGTNTNNNGYRISLPAKILWMLILRPQGGAATLGALGS